MSYDPKNHPHQATCPFCGTVSHTRDTFTAFVETGVFKHELNAFSTETEGSMFYCEPCKHSFVVCAVREVP